MLPRRWQTLSPSRGVLQSFFRRHRRMALSGRVVARNGRLAAELARAGSIAAPHAFEGERGSSPACRRLCHQGRAYTAERHQEHRVRQSALRDGAAGVLTLLARDFTGRSPRAFR
jgi:hypothetical protein